MQILKGLSYSKGDYVHDDEVVHIEDAVTGEVYELYLRRPDPADNGGLCLVIPRSIVKNVLNTEQSVIIELGGVHS